MTNAPPLATHCHECGRQLDPSSAASTPVRLWAGPLALTATHTDVCAECWRHRHEPPARRITHCVDCGAELVRHPDEPANAEKRCAPCWRRWHAPAAELSAQRSAELAAELARLAPIDPRD